MGAVIKVRTISSVTETTIQMVNNTFARLVSIGTSWNTIRLGLRMHMADTGADLTGTPTFAMGFCAGTASQFGDATTTHFVGLKTNAATWNRSANFYNNATAVPTKRVGSTTTTGTSLLNLVIPNGLGTGQGRYIFFVDLIKGSPNYTIKLFCDQTGTSGDQSAATFLAKMELVTPSLSGYTYSSGQTIAVNESTNGTLDCVNVSWDRTTPVIEICDMAVAILA
jgi:hypothetical protein